MDNSIKDVPQDTWTLRKDVMAYIVQSLPIAVNKDHVATVLYSNQASVRFTLDEFFTEASIRTQITNFPQSGAVSERKTLLPWLERIIERIIPKLQTQWLDAAEVSEASMRKWAWLFSAEMGVACEMDVNKTNPCAVPSPRYLPSCSLKTMILFY